MALHGKQLPDTLAKLAARKAFKHATLTGVEGRSYDTGQLLREFAHAYRTADVAYTVYSYATPIAWVLADGTVVQPDVKYSRTTSVHQGVAARGLGH